MKSFQLLPLLLIACCITACSKCSRHPPKTAVLVENPGLLNEEVKKIISDRLAATDTCTPLIIAQDTLYSEKLLLDFYFQTDFNVAWTNKGVFNKQGDSLFSILKNASEYGLIANDYHYRIIDSLLRTEKDSITKKFDAIKISEAELLLTDAFFTLVLHLSKGRLNSDSLTREWKGSIGDTLLIGVLKSALCSNTIHSAIDSQEPQNKEYQKLKLALKKFKTAIKNLPLYSLKKRDSLQNAICLIEINMERWRLYKAPVEKQFVWVNIPSYEMRVMEEDTLVMKSRIIVGKPANPTPLLKSILRNFLIYPYWNVPVSIATKELLPILKRDTSYLRKHNFDVFDFRNNMVDPMTINWKKCSINYFPWKLRQRTGEDNSLGIFKFNFENKYGVYLHDTNNHSLFSKKMRALSHGCVRVEKFMEFAKFLIRDDSIRYPIASLKNDLLIEKQKYVYLMHPVVIYIRYFTAEMDESDALHFYNDVYNYDKKMMNSLGFH